MSEPSARESLTDDLRAAGVEVGSVGGQRFREVVATRLLRANWTRLDAEVAPESTRDAVHAAARSVRGLDQAPSERAPHLRSVLADADAAGGAEGFHGDGVEVVVEMEDCP